MNQSFRSSDLYLIFLFTAVFLLWGMLGSSNPRVISDLNLAAEEERDSVLTHMSSANKYTNI